MKAASAFTGVKSDLTYSRSESPRKIFSLRKEPLAGVSMTISDMVLLLRDLVTALAEGVQTHEQRRPERHHERRHAERAADQLRVGRVVDAHLEVQLPEVDVADVEPVGPAGLVLAVEVRDVLARLAVDALLRFLDQRAALAERQRAARAHGRARGREAAGLARGA